VQGKTKSDLRTSQAFLRSQASTTTLSAPSVDIGKKLSPTEAVVNRGRKKGLLNTLKSCPSQQSCHDQKQASQEWNFDLH